MNNFEYFDFIDNFSDEDNSLVEDIGYLVKKISTIEKLCKKRQDEVMSSFLSETSKEKEQKQNQKMENNKCRKLIVYSNTESNDDKRPNFKTDSQDNNQDDVNKIDLEDTSEIEETPLEAILKKVYRKVALKFHPDKNKDKKAQEIFKSATKANEEKNLSKLLFILNLTNVSVKFDEEDTKIINDEKDKLDKKLSDLKTSIFYKWDKMEQSVKDRYIDYLKKINGIN